MSTLTRRRLMCGSPVAHEITGSNTKTARMTARKGFRLRFTDRLVVAVFATFARRAMASSGRSRIFCLSCARVYASPRAGLCFIGIVLGDIDMDCPLRRETDVAFHGRASSGTMDTHARSNSATDQACATQPRGWCGAAPSKISPMVPTP